MTVKIGRNALKRLLQMATGRRSKSSMDMAAIESAEAALDNSEPFESPMNQGHGKTVDDYKDIPEQPLWKVSNGYETDTLHADTRRKAASNSNISGLLSVKRIN